MTRGCSRGTSRRSSSTRTMRIPKRTSHRTTRTTNRSRSCWTARTRRTGLPPGARRRAPAGRPERSPVGCACVPPDGNDYRNRVPDTARSRSAADGPDQPCGSSSPAPAHHDHEGVHPCPADREPFLLLHLCDATERRSVAVSGGGDPLPHLHGNVPDDQSGGEGAPLVVATGRGDGIDELDRLTGPPLGRAVGRIPVPDAELRLRRRAGSCRAEDSPPALRHLYGTDTVLRGMGASPGHHEAPDRRVVRMRGTRHMARPRRRSKRSGCQHTQNRRPERGHLPLHTLPRGGKVAVQSHAVKTPDRSSRRPSQAHLSAMRGEPSGGGYLSNKGCHPLGRSPDPNPVFCHWRLLGFEYLVLRL